MAAARRGGSRRHQGPPRQVARLGQPGQRRQGDARRAQATPPQGKHFPTARQDGQSSRPRRRREGRTESRSLGLFPPNPPRVAKAKPRARSPKRPKKKKQASPIRPSLPNLRKHHVHLPSDSTTRSPVPVPAIASSAWAAAKAPARQNQRQGPQRPEGPLRRQPAPRLRRRQMPLIRRIPKRGFNKRRLQDHLRPGHLAELEKHFERARSMKKACAKRDWSTALGTCVKILGDGDVTKKFVLKVNAISASAKEKAREGRWHDRTHCRQGSRRPQQRQDSRQDGQAREGQGRVDSRQEGLVRFRHAHRVTRLLSPDGPRGHGNGSGVVGRSRNDGQQPARTATRPLSR